MQNIEELSRRFREQLDQACKTDELEKLRVSYLGKKGSITELLKGLKDLSGEERKEAGQRINKFKNEAQEFIQRKAKE